MSKTREYLKIYDIYQSLVVKKVTHHAAWRGRGLPVFVFSTTLLRAARHSRVLKRGSVHLHVKPSICATHLHRLRLQRVTADRFQKMILGHTRWRLVEAIQAPWLHGLWTLLKSQALLLKCIVQNINEGCRMWMGRIYKRRWTIFYCKINFLLHEPACLIWVWTSCWSLIKQSWFNFQHASQSVFKFSASESSELEQCIKIKTEKTQAKHLNQIINCCYGYFDQKLNLAMLKFTFNMAFNMEHPLLFWTSNWVKTALESA